ncbi:MAG: T9SS type A sorting domain-containing protein [Hymenobacter sp.]|nr:MAG: T9SS type A sorting domain-containing protein [Hymenobacter sp.]
MNLRFLTLVVGLVTGLVSHSASAQVTAPTQGGEVSAVRVTATTMELSFGTRGTGQGRVVAIAATPGGMSIPLAAVDGRFYNGAAVYGQGDALSSGYVIYSGTGHSLTITGLQPNTYYYITNAEYNTDGASIAYNTRGSSMATATRNAPTAPTPLPVELTAFDGTVDARGITQLRWTTASERNTHYFAIERSDDGVSFTEASQVAAAGNSTQLLAYQWSDPRKLTAPTHYRLRQADNDGAVHYSNVVALSPPLFMAPRIDVYPNPSAGQPMQMLLQGFNGKDISIQLSDALGHPVSAQSFTPTQAQYSVPLTLSQGLAPGTYLLTLTGTGSPIQKRIIVSD